MSTKKTWLKAALLVAALAVPAAMAMDNTKAGAAAKPAAHGAFTPGDMKWMDGPPFLAPGAKMAVLQGDPGKAEAFTVRLRLPDGYKILPHWHPTTENVTVISGTLHLGTGDMFDDSKGTTLGAGSFGYVGPHMHHYAWSTGDTEIQIHGIGPFAVNYIHPADDPRNAKK
jgi:hypothetical protein